MTPSLFVWIPRCGGTSVWTWLCKHGGERVEIGPNQYRFAGLDVVTAMHWPERVWRRHAKGRFVFSFRRDTYTRLESIAAYKGWTSLEQFVRHVTSGRRIQMPKYHPQLSMAAPQATWLARDGQRMVQLVGRTETLGHDFSVLRRTLSWPEHVMPHENRRERTFTDTWTDELRSMVQSTYSEDFRLFGEETDA